MCLIKKLVAPNPGIEKVVQFCTVSLEPFAYWRGTSRSQVKQDSICSMLPLFLFLQELIREIRR